MTYKHMTKLTVTSLKYCTAQNPYLLCGMHMARVFTMWDAYGESIYYVGCIWRELFGSEEQHMIS